jgi:hypothetical protein
MFCIVFYSLFNLNWNATADKKNLLGMSCHDLIATARKVPETTGHWIVRNKPQTHLAAHHYDPALVGLGSLDQEGAMAAYVFLAEAAVLGHQIADPQTQAVDEYMGAWRGTPQLFDQQEALFLGLPAPPLPLPAVFADAFLHL